MECIMLADTFPLRLAFWLGRVPRLDAVPAMREPEPAREDALSDRPPRRPAIDVETRLLLRDRGWWP
jgi:hypothetical protein